MPVAPPVFAYWQAVHDLRERLGGGAAGALRLGAPRPRSWSTRFTAATGIAVHQGYGLTEAAPVVTSTLCSAHAEAGSVGAALPGIEIRLVDEAGDAPEGEDPGEIQVRGDNLFSGYWPDGERRPRRGRLVRHRRRRASSTATATCSWSTGSRSWSSSPGSTSTRSRSRTSIAEVDGVAEAAVIGIADERTGEAVVAYVVPSRRVVRRDRARGARCREHCAERLARFKQPSEVHVVDELPHTVTGKVAKGRLRAAERRRTPRAARRHLDA